MEEDIEKMQDFIMLLRDEPEDNPKAFLEIDYTSQKELAQTIEKLINKYEEQEKMIKLMSRTMHYICLFRSQSKYVIRKYCKIYKSGNVGECEGLICSECVANYFRKKAKGE